MKKLCCIIGLLLGLLLVSHSAEAQTPFERTKQISKIGGKEYYMHVVKAGQTFEQIEEVYQVSQKEVIFYNPEMKDGLKTGYVIGLPVRPMKVVEPEPIIEEPEPEPIIEEPEPVIEEPEPEPIIEEPEPEPVIEEPEPEPIIEEPEPVIEKPEPEPVIEEPEPEPIIEEPEPVIEEPEPEPIIEEPDPEPVIEEPEPEPIIEEPELEPIIEEPDPEPVIEEPEPEPVIEELEPEPIIEELEPEPIIEKPEPVVVKVGGRYIVQANEDLYDIAKKFGIDIADFKAANPGLTTEPYAGMWISVPDIANENDYIVHKCEFNERTTSLLKRWKVDEGEFRAMNVSVGSHVFVNQVVLIPIERIRPEHEVVDEPIVEEFDEPQQSEQPEQPEPTEPDEPINQADPIVFYNEPMETPECFADPDNAERRYKVALMVPLYLNDVSNIEISKDNLSNLQKNRSLSFLPFYEGFMMAVERMVSEESLKLDLTVIDVTENVSTAQNAVRQLERHHCDLIVGPFFSKSFDVVKNYAAEHNILMVNPLSMRNEVVEGNANVIKLKPSMSGQILDIACLVRNHYPDANVFILSREKMADSLFLTQLEHELNLAVNDEVTISGDEFLQFAKDESQRLEMGSRMVSTITVEGQVYSTNDLRQGNMSRITLENPVRRYAYNSENLRKLTSQLSGVRDNVIIAYGDDNVFATQVLNTLKKEADRYPITLVCGPDWTKFEKLLVESLLQMNAIYITDNFVDYHSAEANRFVREFRSRYAVEPQEYAFEGYDVATYFLTALMRYGTEMAECLPYFTMPLMHTQYHFMRKGKDNGLENQNWSLYQYEKEEIALIRVNPFKKAAE